MAGQRRERKVVTVVFCDLVGFTSGRVLDPETSRRCFVLTTHASAKSPKATAAPSRFIGDAVMALFAPQHTKTT
jgi:class 3 adenylate cyclase